MSRASSISAALDRLEQLSASDWTRVALKPSALVLTALLAGCASSAGLGGLSLGGAPEAAAPAPEAQLQLTTLPPGETPPVPVRRPGKRPKALAAAAKPTSAPAPAPVQVAAAPAPVSESSGFSLGNLFASTPVEAKETQASAPAAESGPDSVLIDKKPVEAYSLLAQRIKYCWLNPTSPRLPNHGFHAVMAPGEIKEAKMVVYEKNAEGRQGTSVFKVDITADSDGALVASQNVKLDKGLEGAFKSDLARWAKGDDRCKA